MNIYFLQPHFFTKETLPILMKTLKVKRVFDLIYINGDFQYSLLLTEYIKMKHLLFLLLIFLAQPMFCQVFTKEQKNFCMSTFRNTILKDFTDEEVSLLERACRYHTTELRTGDPTIDVCFDADRLDLGRVGIVPNPKLMATEQGAYYAANINLINKLEI